MKTALITPYTDNSLRAVKIASLYFDQIELQQHSVLQIEPVSKNVLKEGEVGVVRDIINFIDEKYLKNIEALLREGIVKVNAEPKGKEVDIGFETELTEYLYRNSEIIVKLEKNAGSIKFKSNLEQTEIHEKLFGPIYKGGLFSLNAIIQYYVAQFSDALRLASNDLPIVSSSQTIYQILKAASGDKIIGKHIDQPTYEQIKPQFAFDVIEALMLDVGDLEIDDILEARLKLNTELLAFRDEIERLQFEFEHEFGIEKVLREGRSIAKARLFPRIKDLEDKVEKGNYHIFKNLTSVLRKPDAYVPMLGTSFAGIPVEISLLISLGIVSAEVAIDAYQDKQNLKKDSMFYLMKLRDKAKTVTSQKSHVTHVSSNDKTIPYALVFPWQVKKVR